MTDVPGRRAMIERTVRDGASSAQWGIAVETPVEIAIGGTPWTVMMATPADLEDLAVGLALTEGVIAHADAIEDVTVANYLDGMSVNLHAKAGSTDASLARRRSLEGRIGCGLCGVEALSGLPRPDARARVRPQIEQHAVRAAFAELPGAQPLNRRTHSVHAAAWCDPAGRIDLVREDVGRHNALDKVVGALARAGRLAEPGFVAMTSRCSFELVYKAALTNAGALATVSAPTSLALDWSARLGLPIVCAGTRGAIAEFPVEPKHAP